MSDSSQKKSAIWLHFEAVGENKAKCKLCRSVYSYHGGTTSNLRKHMRNKHMTVRIEEELNRPREKRPLESEMVEVEDETAPGAESQPSTSGTMTDSLSTISKTRSKKSKQSSLNSYVSRPISLLRQKKINDLVLNMIVKDLQPFSIVRDQGFLQLLQGLEPSYQPPSRNTFVNSFLEQRYDQAVDILKVILKETEYITLTTDAWTSSANQSYTSVTAHFISRKWKFISCLLDCFNFTESHTAQNICDEIKRIATKWEISEKIHVAVTDNAANVVAAIRFTNWTHLPCFAHTLNLIVQHGLTVIHKIRVKVKTTVEYFHRSTQANSRLLSTQTRINPDNTPLKLKNDVATRWNSTYYMFERLIQLEESITVAVGLLHNPIQLLSEEEWIILKEICRVLQPFEQVTTEMSSEKSITVSKIIVIVGGITSVLKQFTTEVQSKTAKDLIADILESVSKRFSNLEFNNVLAKASLLDPRFKQNAFSCEDAIKKAKDKLKDEAVALIKNRDNAKDQVREVTPVERTSSPEPNLIWQNFDRSVKSTVQAVSPLATAITEIRMYLEEPLIARMEDPLMWWEHRENLYPTLSILAKKYLSVVATSVPSERVFSKAGQIISERRNRLTAKHVEKLIFLNHNQYLLNFEPT